MPHVISHSPHSPSLPNLPFLKDLYLLPIHLSPWATKKRLVISFLSSLRKISGAIESKMPFTERHINVLRTLRKHSLPIKLGPSISYQKHSNFRDAA